MNDTKVKQVLSRGDYQDRGEVKLTEKSWTNMVDLYVKIKQ
jgi:hypothetical protein